MKFHVSQAFALVLVLLATGCKRREAQMAAAVKNQIGAKIAAIRAVGDPVNLSEFNAWYIEPATTENAAPIYLEAFATLTADDPTQPIALARNQKALTLFHQAATRSQCRYPVDLSKGLEARLPHLSKFKSSVQLLTQSTTNHAAKGEMDLAVQSFLDSLSLVRSLEQEPVLISQLVHHAGANLVLASLEFTLSRQKMEESTLKKLQTTVADSERGTSLIRSIKGDRCTGISVFDLPPAEQSRIFQAGAQGGSSSLGSLKTMELTNYRLSPTYLEDEEFYLDRMAEVLSACDQPYPECLARIEQWQASVGAAKTKGYRLSAALLPDLTKAAEITATSIAKIRAAVTGIAVERYRRAHENALPDSLKALVPQFLAGVPVDPFDGQPIRYHKSANPGYVIYSLGPDKQDQRGTPKPTPFKSGVLYDVTFIVNR